MNNRPLKILAVAGAVTFLCSPAVRAVTITEGASDRLDRPLVFNLIGAVRGSDLNSVRGSLNSPTDVDLYSFILSPRSFSTTTSGTSIDTQLFLFDSLGVGICSNDDRARGTFTSSLTAGTCGIAPNEAGLYHLAISAYNIDPVSRDGFIFPDPPFDPNGSLGTFGPTGLGGARPLSGWSGPTTSGGNYTISLRGASLFSTDTSGGNTGGGTPNPPDGIGFPPDKDIPFCRDVVGNVETVFCKSVVDAPQPSTLLVLGAGLLALLGFRSRRGKMRDAARWPVCIFSTRSRGVLIRGDA